MTFSTTAPATTPAPGTTPPGVRALGWLAAAGTLPYLGIKLLWLTGSTVGVTEPAFLSEPAIVVGNAITFALDLVVIGLALALTHRWGDRLPAWLVLLPMWVGTGFLAPMVVSIAPAIAVETLTDGPRTAAFEPWLQPVVYGGFAWQGAFLGAAFVAHAVRRWSGVISTAARPAAGLAPLLRVVAGGGCAMAAASALFHLIAGITAGLPVGIGVETVNAAFAVAGAAGVVALVRARPTPRRAAVAAAWTGSAVLFSWGLYTVTIGMTTTMLGGGGMAAAAGAAQVTGLLGGFALAVAGMLALVGAGETRRG